MLRILYPGLSCRGWSIVSVHIGPIRHCFLSLLCNCPRSWHVLAGLWVRSLTTPTTCSWAHWKSTKCIEPTTSLSIDSSKIPSTSTTKLTNSTNNTSFTNLTFLALMSTISIRPPLLYYAFMRWWNHWKLIIKCCTRLWGRIKCLRSWRRKGLRWWTSRSGRRSWWIRRGLLPQFPIIRNSENMKNIKDKHLTSSPTPKFSFYPGSSFLFWHLQYFGEFTAGKVWKILALPDTLSHLIANTFTLKLRQIINIIDYHKVMCRI